MDMVEELSALERARVGDTLPQRSFDIGLSDVVAMSLATRDFHPVHHDAHAASKLGHRSVFINIMTTAALIETFVRAWCGSQGRLAALRLKLGVAHYAGESLLVSGEVTERGEDEHGHWVTVEFSASNPRGRHASGLVRVLWS